jgi:hypothetical protein
MSTQETRDRLELLQGTLDLLILRTLIFGSQHGQGIARAIQQTSEEERPHLGGAGLRFGGVQCRRARRRGYAEIAEESALIIFEWGRCFRSGSGPTVHEGSL